jgi:Type IIA topoisomerase (DNA gyrase/topo II, topoisomerase IV), A subunit
VSSRTGLDWVTLSVLESLDALGARPEYRYAKSSRVVEHAYASHAIPPRFAYEAMCAQAADWLTQILLFDPHGNFGSPDWDDPPADARYTEVRLAPAGWMALAAERGELPRLPIGLINGDLSFGGTAPPFDPTRVGSALRAAVEGAPDYELVELIGLPVFPVACSVEGDFGAIASGNASRLRLRARVVIESDTQGSRLVMSHFPFAVGAENAGRFVAERIGPRLARDLGAQYPDLVDRVHIPLSDVRNESHGDLVRVVCDLEPDADPELCRDRVLEVWPVTTEIMVQLRVPLARLLRDLVDGSDAQQDAITELISL